MHIGEGISGARFSEDKQYRYSLWRIWNREKPYMIFVGLNPSRADEIRDDATITRMICRAKLLSYGGLYVGNLFAVISPDSKLIYGDNAIGIDNDKYLEELNHVAGIIVVGWGTRGSFANRDKRVLDILGKPVYCLKITKGGQPMHPLYINYDIGLKEYQFTSGANKEDIK